MNNYILRKLIGNTFYWDQYEAIAKKVGARLYDRVWDKLKLPFTHQIITPINQATLIAIRKENK